MNGSRRSALECPEAVNAASTPVARAHDGTSRCPVRRGSGVHGPDAWQQLVDWEADCILERDWHGSEPDEQELEAVLLLAGAGLLDGFGTGNARGTHRVRLAA